MQTINTTEQSNNVKIEGGYTRGSGKPRKNRFSAELCSRMEEPRKQRNQVGSSGMPGEAAQVLPAGRVLALSF